MMTTPFKIIVFCTTLLGAMVWSCTYPEGPAAGNAPPRTRLANVPANDTIAQYIRLGALPEITLYWLGDDPDGFVVGYKYRWTDRYKGTVAPQSWKTIMNIATLGGAPVERVIMVNGTPHSWFALYNLITTLDPVRDSALVRILGDSLATGRSFAVPYKTGIVPGDSIYGGDPEVNETPTRGKFIFDSPVDSNMHTFEVASIDNNDAIDPFPPSVNFWTLQSPAPRAIINTVPATGQFSIRYRTERFQGLQFTYSSIDPSTFEHEYSWSVDDTVSWSPWSTDGVALVTASSFKPVATGVHTFYVRAKNRWGVVSPAASRTFFVIVPAFDDPNFRPRTLIINNDVNGSGTRGKPDTNQVNAFYRELMEAVGKAGQYDIWVTAGRTGKAFPPREMYGDYSSVILVSEQTFPSIGADAQFKVTPEKSALITEYLNVGGKLIVSGPPDAHRFILPESFISQVLHTVPVTLQSPVVKNPQLDFVGAIGRLGYPNVLLDTAKIPADSGGALRNIELNFPRGFAQTIFGFDSKSNNEFENLPLGVRYLAPAPVPPARATYSTVYLGFPLYYARKNDAIQTLKQAFIDLTE